MIRDNEQIREYDKFQKNQGEIREFHKFDNISGENQGTWIYLPIYLIFKIIVNML